MNNQLRNIPAVNELLEQPPMVELAAELQSSRATSAITGLPFAIAITMR